MKTDLVKTFGKIQEQIEIENKSRRNYPRKWSTICQEAPWKEIYNQDEINRQIKIDLSDHNPFVYSNEGDSCFVSPEMYKSLAAVCRCGRPRCNLHLLKCLQNQQNKYSSIDTADEMNDESGGINKLPKTSSGFLGWQSKQPTTYKKWENSMKYVSPVSDMPGKKITAASYNVMIIG